MRFFFASAIVGLTVVATLSTPASAWQCMARSTNGAVGLGSGIILETGPKICNSQVYCRRRKRLRLRL